MDDITTALQLNNLMQKVRLLEEENVKLKTALMDASRSSPFSLSQTQEENICQIEIGRLNDKAYGGPLSMEDTKRLEILVRTLYLIKDKLPEKSDDDKANDIQKLLEVVTKDG